MKGHNSSGGNNSYSYRGGGGKTYAYGMMLLVGFGAAMFGVMVLHKLRERRIFNLLLNHKDRDLLSLHHLFQKESDYNKEARKKAAEMKAEIYSLRTQKMELNSKISDMQSTIPSLKEERRAIETALEEKQNEIKLLRERDTETNKENPQVIALTETLKQKEAEIEDLKRRLEYSVKVWSVSSDDPTNAAVNLTNMASMKEVSGRGLHESTRYKDTENASRAADESRNESFTYHNGDNSVNIAFSGTRGTTDEHSQKMENSRDDIFRDGSSGGEKSIDKVRGKKSEDSRDEEGLGIKEEKHNANAAKKIVNGGEDEESMDGKEHGVTRIGQIKNITLRGGEGQKLRIHSRGGIKLQMPDNLQAGAGYGVRGKHGYTSNLKGKSWRIIASNVRLGRLRDNVLEKLDRQKGDRNVDLTMKDASGLGNGRLNVYGNHRGGESLEMKNDEQVGLEGRERKDGRKAIRTAGLSADANSVKPRNSEDAENESIKVGNTDTNQQIEKGQEMDVHHENSKKCNRTLDDMAVYRTVDGEASGTAGDASKSKQKLDELGQQLAENAGIVKQQIETRDEGKEDRISEEAEVAEPDYLEVGDT